MEKNECKCGRQKYVYQEVCWMCMERQEIAEIWECSKRDKAITGEIYIICPYCGDHYGEDDMHESTTVTCEECDKKFKVEIEYSPSYSTYQIPVVNK